MKLRKLFMLLVFFPLLAFGETIPKVNQSTLKSTIESIIKNEDPSNILVLWNTDMFLKGKNNLRFENNIKTVIQELQNKGIKIIGVSSTLTQVNPVSKKRYVFEYRDMLQKQGVDFSKSYPSNFIGPVATYFDFPRTHQYYPMFYHGILSFNGKQTPTFKADVLKAFLFAASAISEDKLGRKGYYPKIIIWINDNNEDLIQTEKSLHMLNKDLIFKGITIIQGVKSEPNILHLKSVLS